jgi:hypothetical protein
LRILSIIKRVLVISARGLDSVSSFGYANCIGGKVCAHIRYGRYLFTCASKDGVVDAISATTDKQIIFTKCEK